MKRTHLAAVALGLALMAGAREAKAQSLTFGVGGGLTIPTGDFNTAANMGWHGIGQLGYGLSSGIGLRADFFYGQNNLDGVSGKTKLAGGLGNISYDFKTAGGVQPYIIGGLGYFQVKVDVSGFGSASESKFAFAGGGGLKFKAGSDSHFYVESRYVSVQTSGSSTGFIPITVGISFATK